MCSMGMTRCTQPSVSDRARGRQSCQDKEPLQGHSSHCHSPHALSPQPQPALQVFISFHIQRISVFPQPRGAKLCLSATISSIPTLNYKFLLMLSFQVQKHLSALPRPKTEGWLDCRTFFFLSGTRLCQSETRERGIHAKFSICCSPQL